jgi:arylsulfatase A-like enzyme
LGYQSVQVGVHGPGDSQVRPTNVVDGLIVHQEGYITMLFKKWHFYNKKAFL